MAYTELVRLLQIWLAWSLAFFFCIAAPAQAMSASKALANPLATKLDTHYFPINHRDPSGLDEEDDYDGGCDPDEGPLNRSQRRSTEAENFLKGAFLPSAGANPTIEFIVGDPLPHYTSKYGHTAIVFNGTTAFSYGTHGMSVMRVDKYIESQKDSGRDSTGFTYSATPEQYNNALDAAKKEFINDPGAWYDEADKRWAPSDGPGGTRYTPSHQCNTTACSIGRAAGLSSASILPSSFLQDLPDVNRLKQVTRYAR